MSENRPGAMSCLWMVSMFLTTALAAAPSGPAETATPHVVVGDLDGDRAMDLVLVDGDRGEVSVRLGQGDATFSPESRFPAGQGAASAAIGDIDGDGKEDLVVLNALSSELVILRGYGDGTFGREVRLTAGDGPTAAAVADFNGDGRQDLALANGGSGDVSLLLGRAGGGDGQELFLAEQRVKVGREPRALGIGDFNADGRPDLAVANRRSNSISILLGEPGEGVFLAQKRLRVGKTPESMVVGDFNDDEVLDLAVVNRGSGDMSVLIGTGGGRFRTNSRYGFIGPVLNIASGDFDSDGWQDLAVVIGGRDVYFLRSLGDGSFRSGPSGLGFSPGFLSAGDFDADGRQDLLAAQGREGVSAWLGRGDGNFVLRPVPEPGR